MANCHKNKYFRGFYLKTFLVSSWKVGVEVLAFGGGGFAVGYGAAGADMVAPQAHGAAVVPFRASVGHHDVARRTGPRAGAAAGAAFGGMEGPRRHGVADEPGIDNPRFYP